MIRRLGSASLSLDLRSCPQLAPAPHWTTLPSATYPAGVLNPTPSSRLVDGKHRPYFLWDEDRTTLDDFVRRLSDPDPETRAYNIGKLMRQANPDDVFTFVTRRDIETLWPRVVLHLGYERAFWTWILARWGELTLDVANDPLASRLSVGGKTILVESHQELLANKLVAMLSRFELRDLADARALMRTGAKLDLALEAAPQKDGGFSGMVLAWVLESFPFSNYRSEPSLPESERSGLEQFRQELIATLVDSSDPGDSVFERP